MEPASTVSLKERETVSAKIETGNGIEWSVTGFQTGTEIERGIVGILKPQIVPPRGERVANGGTSEKSGMERVKESEAVGRSGSTKSAQVAQSEKGGVRKIRGPKEKMMHGATRMSERKGGTGKSARASGQAKVGVERGGTKVSARVGNGLGHAPGAVRNQRRRAGSMSAATAKSTCTNTVTAENAVTAEMPATGKTI